MTTENEEFQPTLEVKSDTKFPSMKYKRTKDWENVRLNILGMLNAFEPTVIDNTENIKNQCIDIIEGELEEAKELYEQMKKDGLTAGSIECEGYIRACNMILTKIQEWV